MTQTYEAMTIAKWFVAWADANEAELSNLKLQKLLYYAQGLHLAANGEPLFPEAIQAWSHGPVVPVVYHAFKKFQSQDVELSEDDDFEFSVVDDETTDFLIGVWNTYGGLAAWKLRDLTHEEPPWKENFKEDVRNVEIPVESMKQFFASRI